MNDDELLADLLIRWEELYELGRDAPAGELCPTDRPQLLPRLADGIAGLKRVGWLTPRSGTAPRVPAANSLVSSRRQGDEAYSGCILDERLGGGAFGEVWSASHPHLGRVAIKFVTGGANESGPAAGRLRAEWQGTQNIRQCRHPFVMSMSMIGNQDGVLVIVSELADGDVHRHVGELWRATSPIRVLGECLGFLWDAAQGLDAIRDNYNLQHGDVKPANLLVFDGRCKVGDFGTVVPLGTEPPPDTPVILCTPAGTTARYRTLAEVPWGAAMRPGATLYTASGGFTPRYAPPEAFLGRISRSSDQYSLALTFCELVYKRLPFSGDGGEQVEHRRRGAMDMEFVPLVLVPILAKALAPNPDDRFRSCVEFIDHLFRRAEQVAAGTAPTFRVDPL